MKIIYKASTKSGEIKEGVIDARDVNQAVYFIRSKEMFPIIVKEKQSTVPFFSFLLPKISDKDLVVFTRQIASMLSSGLTLVQALAILQDQMQKSLMKEMIHTIVADIQEGKTFSYAISKYPNIFSPVYISLIKSGEASGLLDKIFERLADTLEKNQKLKSTIIAAIIYPVLVLCLMVVVVVVIMIFVIPQLETLYSNLGTSLPVPTQIVIGVSHFVTQFYLLLIGILILGAFVYRRWIHTEIGKLLQDKLLIHIPFIGKLIRYTILTEFTRTFGVLTNAGILVVESLEKTADSAGNIIYKDAIIDVSHRVEKGITVGDAMATYDIFPPVLVQMVKTGEETGRLDESLLKVSEYFEREVEVAVKTITTTIEPLMIVLLGIGVAFLMISVIAPIYNITSQIR